MFNHLTFRHCRWDEVPELIRTTVWVDPAVTITTRAMPRASTPTGWPRTARSTGSTAGRIGHPHARCCAAPSSGRRAQGRYRRRRDRPGRRPVGVGVSRGRRGPCRGRGDRTGTVPAYACEKRARGMGRRPRAPARCSPPTNVGSSSRRRTHEDAGARASPVPQDQAVRPRRRIVLGWHDLMSNTVPIVTPVSMEQRNTWDLGDSAWRPHRTCRCWAPRARTSSGRISSRNCAAIGWNRVVREMTIRIRSSPPSVRRRDDDPPG